MFYHFYNVLPICSIIIWKFPMDGYQRTSTRSCCRPLRQACCGLLAAKLQAIHQVFDELILHAEVTFVWLVEEAQFEELPNLLLDFAKLAREVLQKSWPFWKRALQLRDLPRMIQVAMTWSENFERFRPSQWRVPS